MLLHQRSFPLAQHHFSTGTADKGPNQHENYSNSPPSGATKCLPSRAAWTTAHPTDVIGASVRYLKNLPASSGSTHGDAKEEFLTTERAVDTRYLGLRAPPTVESLIIAGLRRPLSPTNLIPHAARPDFNEGPLT